MVTNLDVLDELATCYDDAGALVAADERELGCKGPVTHDGVEVCVAYSGVFDVDQNLCVDQLIVLP